MTSQDKSGSINPRYDYVSLQFCNICDTAYAMQISDGKQTLICRNCGHDEATDLLVVHRTNYEHSESDKDYMFNEDSRHDVTLPISTIEPCVVCGKTRAKYMKAHDNKMALMFFCLDPECRTVWRK